MRVYVPTTLSSLARLLADDALPAGVATAVTPDLRAALPPTMDDEELELEALLDAAELSLALLADDPSTGRRRVVLAADVPEATVRPAGELGPAGVRLTEPLVRSAVVSAHVDEASAEPSVAAGDVEGLDLLWYAPQELADLCGP